MFDIIIGIFKIIAGMTLIVVSASTASDCAPFFINFLHGNFDTLSHCIFGLVIAFACFLFGIVITLNGVLA